MERVKKAARRTFETLALRLQVKQVLPPTNQRPALFLLFAAAITVAGLSCDTGTVPGREEYIEIWTIACLRSREKGTEPAEELAGLLAADSIDAEAFEKAEELYFSEESLTAVRRGIRRVLESPGFISRPEYIRMRVAAYVRSKVRGTPFSFEIGCVTEKKGCRREDFYSSERIWAGDADTTAEIKVVFESRSQALGASWAQWTEISGNERFTGPERDDWVRRELESRGIPVGRWQALEELFLVTRVELARFKVIANLRSVILGTSFDSEMAQIADRQGFNLKSYAQAAPAAEDDEAVAEEERQRLRLSGAIRVPLAAYRSAREKGASSRPEKAREAIAAELKQRGIAPADYEAIDEVLRR